MTAVLGQTTAGASVRLDVERLVESRLLVQANSGAGKSWALRRILEQTHGAVQHIVLDVEDEFHTLRERFDYVLAGRHGGDCPADVKAAPLLARRLLELGVSAVVGLYELKAHERQRFVRQFLDALIGAPRSLWHPALVVVDEAHIFAPQNGKAESAAAVIDLMTRGRKRGFCGVLATQRISKLHKDAAAEANNKLIGRSALDVDMRRAAEELGFATKDQQRSLRELSPGHFYAFGPAIAAQVVEVLVGDVQTTHPKAGQRAAPPPPPRAVIQQVLAQLADLPKEADAEAKTMVELQAEVSSLKAQLRAAEKAAPAPVPERVEVPVVDRRFLQQVSDAVADVERVFRALQVGVRAIDELPAVRERLRAAAASATVAAAQKVAPPPRANGTRVRPTATIVTPPLSVASAPAAEVAGPEQRILDALAWLESVGLTSASNAAAAFLAGYSHKSTSYTNPRGALNQRGLISYPSPGQVALTAEGRVLARAPNMPLTTKELHDQVFAKLGGPEQRILRPLLEAYPHPLTNDDIATCAGYSASSTSYTNPRGRLRSLELIDYPAPGSVRAADVLFLEGR
jgi:hypothetical protein